MRHLSALTITLLGFCPFILDCSSERTPTGPSAVIQSDSTYIGSWSWIKSRGGFGGETITPQSEGHTVRIELSPDSVYTVNRSGEEPVSRRFSIHREKFPHSSDSVDVISFPNDSIHMSAIISLLGRDTLRLVDQYMDGYDSYYFRER